ncbi:MULTISPECIES: hypothetical protein [Chryseobacterium]|uniref:Uncharacterized protein n=1 Tax=Candidatus Chryseobacterium massiliense TaxID=204089 RepID=A0A3D9B3C9_9FLAO|nr:MULTISPECIES: hypothetical protein [Chryseobacterium]REC47857.1 hypothetical protein DRF68_12510 [Candidatus Chryseobacterium massiliae]
MEEFIINAQEYIIEEILEHLECGSVGIGISKSWNCEKLDNSNLKFTLKPECEINPKDFFWFGYLTPNR